MRVLINGLVAFQGGHKTYFRNLVPLLGRLRKQHEFILLSASWQDVFNIDLPPNIIRLEVGPRRRSVWARVLWEISHLPFLIKRYRIDVMYAPVLTSALYCPPATIVDIRDTNVFSPLETNNLDYLFRNLMLRGVAYLVTARASRIVFVSKRSRDTVLKSINLDPARTSVIYHGCDPLFFKSTKSSPNICSFPRPYILTVSDIYTHKNYLRMLDAFSLICQADSDLGYDYVFAGANLNKTLFDSLKERMNSSDISGRVHYLGEVPYERLPALYQQASLYVLPSQLETFGLTLVEAMASGVPIAASSTSSIPEIAGEAAVYFDPLNIDDIAKTMRSVLQNQSLSRKLIEVGRERALGFSWENAAQQMLLLFESVYQERLSNN
jgi:glycosyltransferase involved in cell wall biosynthesis